MSLQQSCKTLISFLLSNTGARPLRYDSSARDRSPRPLIEHILIRYNINSASLTPAASYSTTSPFHHPVATREGSLISTKDETCGDRTTHGGELISQIRGVIPLNSSRGTRGLESTNYNEGFPGGSFSPCLPYADALDSAGPETPRLPATAKDIESLLGAILLGQPRHAS